jgi:hypothetical protein
VSAIASVVPQVAPVVPKIAHVGSPLSAVGSDLLGIRLHSVLVARFDIGSSFASVPTYLARIVPNLSSIGADLASIIADFLTVLVDLPRKRRGCKREHERARHDHHSLHLFLHVLAGIVCFPLALDSSTATEAVRVANGVRMRT